MLSPRRFAGLLLHKQVLSPRRFAGLLLHNKCSGRVVSQGFCCTTSAQAASFRITFAAQPALCPYPEGSIFILPGAGLNDVPGMLMVTPLDSDEVINSGKNWWSIKKLECQGREYSF